MCLAVFPMMLTTYLVWSLSVVAFERSDHYVEAAAVTVVAATVLAYALFLPGLGPMRLVERWAAGHEVDAASALGATYSWARASFARVVGVGTVWLALLLVVVGVIAGASPSRLVQYGVLGAVSGFGLALTGTHGFAEAMMRPARVAIAGDTGIGDSLPRSRPTYAAWSTVSMIAGAFGFAVSGAMLAVVFSRTSSIPVLCAVIALALTLGWAVPINVGSSFAPSLRPIRDLAEGTERVAAGDYSQRLPVVQDDDLGALAASFNRMQAGLAERQRLQAAFGTYVDPPWRRGYSSRVMMFSPVSAVR